MNRRQSLENIPIEKINILNPRERNRKIANEIKKNIEDVGLKRPITVSRRLDFTDGKEYDLVCGQGRLEAYIANNQKCSAKQLTAQDVQALYEQEIKRTKLIIAKNDRVENSLIFVTQSIKSLLGNENFYNLLKVEELEKLPKYLAERLQIHG